MAFARWLAPVAIVLAGAPVLAGERAVSGASFPFRAGALLGHSELLRARDWLPPEARAHVRLLLPASGRVRLRAPTAALAADAQDCGGDPAAAARVIWSLVQVTGAAARDASWAYGHRARHDDGEVPGDARGVTILRYRNDATRVAGEPTAADLWIYLPERTAPAEERARSAYSWSCLGRADVLGPVTANGGEAETWALREGWVIRFETEGPSGPHPSGVFYLDGVSLEPLFGFAYDRLGALRRIVVADRRVIDVEPRSNAERK